MKLLNKIHKLNYKTVLLVVLDLFSILIALYSSVLLINNGLIDQHYMSSLSHLLIPIIILDLIIFSFFKLYQSLWEFASFLEIRIIIYSAISSTLSNAILYEITGNHLPISSYFIFFMLITMFISFSRYSTRMLFTVKNKYNPTNKEKRDLEKIMIIGAGSAGEQVLREIICSKNVYKEVICFIDDDAMKLNKTVHGVPVYGNRNSIVDVANKFDIDEIIVAIPSLTKKETAKILNICNKTRCSLKQVPGIYQLLNGNIHMSDIKEVQIEDLLGRESIDVNLSEIMQYVNNKIVMVTGGGGSI